MPHAASGAPRIETIRLVGTAPSGYNGNIGSWFASILCFARLSRGMQHALSFHPLTGHGNRFALERGRYERLRTTAGISPRQAPGVWHALRLHRLSAVKATY